MQNSSNPNTNNIKPTQIESTNTLKKTTFNFSRDQLIAFAAVAFSEQISIKGAATELKVLQNSFNYEFGGVYHGVPGEKGFYDFVKNWVYGTQGYMDSGHLADYAGGGPVKDEMIDVAEAVLNEGIGIVPDYVDRIDSFVEKDYRAQNPIYDEDGKIDHWEDITFDLDEYKPGTTHINNIYDINGYTFYGFSDSDSKYPDILGYSSKTNKIMLGDSCSSYEDLMDYLSSKEKSRKQNNLNSLNEFANFVENNLNTTGNFIVKTSKNNTRKSSQFRKSMSAGISKTNHTSYPNSTQLSPRDKHNIRETDKRR